MPLKLVIDEKIEVFLSKISSELEKNPSVHSLLLSLSAKYLGKEKPPFRMLRATLENGELGMAGLQTDPDRYLILSNADPALAEEFASQLSEKIPSLHGITAPAATAEAFAKVWTAKKQCPKRVEADMRLFEVTKLKPARPCPGFFRKATLQDDQLVTRWRQEFLREAAPSDPIRSDEEALREMREEIEKDRYFLWEDGEPVCLVGSTRETPREGWIGPVYTPPKWRGRGYATALVEKVSEKILSSGKTALLFTDLANPTSNKIYQDLGYVPLSDFRNLLFWE